MLHHSPLDAIQTPHQDASILVSESDQALLSRMRTARAEYGQAVADFLDAVRRYSKLPINDLEKEELLRHAREGVQAAFSRYKEAVEAT